MRGHRVLNMRRLRTTEYDLHELMIGDLVQGLKKTNMQLVCWSFSILNVCSVEKLRYPMLQQVASVSHCLHLFITFVSDHRKGNH